MNGAKILHGKGCSRTEGQSSPEVGKDGEDTADFRKRAAPSANGGPFGQGYPGEVAYLRREDSNPGVGGWKAT